MSDNVVEFPERRDSIPVNLPDIGCLEAAVCPKCGFAGRVWTVMIQPGNPVPLEYRCAVKSCDYVVSLCIEVEPA